VIVPDYARPAALMVPHAPGDFSETLEAIAMAAARAVGVILLSPEPVATERFVARQPDPSRFTIVAAEFDSAWIRDRSPLPVRRRGGYKWVLPALQSQRPRDDVLFQNIVARELEFLPLVLLGGNLVAGPKGVALSTRQVLEQNGLDDASALSLPGRTLGIRRWIVVPKFERELSGHVDVCTRFLSPRLLAVAWNEESTLDQETAKEIEDRVGAEIPGIQSIRFPLRAEGSLYASPVNWIQLGKLVLVPRYPITPATDLEVIEGKLLNAGFETCFVDSPTAQFGGSLHCLTASIFV
jgi:agmatine/peptidylarginine deiminase